MDATSCLQKQESVKAQILACPSMELRYQKIIEWGRALPPFPQEFKTESRIVPGCQSIVYLHASLEKGAVRFQISSEALISSGLAALLLAVYDNEPAEIILTCPPRYLEALGLQSFLSPGRSNGLASIYLRMKQEALQFLTQS